jgi:cell volume regulation protein A
MEPGTLILVVGAILVAAVAAATAAGKAGVPVLVAFLGLGMVLGSDGPGGIEFSDAHLARTVGIVGLAVILFEGGITTPWRAIRPVLLPATMLSTVGVVVSTLITGVVAHAVFPLSWSASMLLGAVVASTDAAAVFSTLRVMSVRRRLARVLEAESGANDPIAVALTIGLIQWVVDRSYGVEDLLVLIVKQLSIGLVIGVAVGAASAWALPRLPGLAVQFAPVATVAAGAIGFGLADVAGGSGFLAVYVTGLFVGNAATPLRRYLVSFHAGLAFLAQVGLFIVLGLFVFPRQLGSVILPGLAVVAVLLFVARPVAVWVSTTFQGFGVRERTLLGWAGLRGAVPIVLATYPSAEGLHQSATIFNAVFFVVLASALIQGPTIEPLAKALGLTGQRGIYQPPLEVAAVDSLGSGLLEFGVAGDSAVVGRHVRDLGLPRDALVAVVVRDGQAIPPRGSTLIESGDRLYVLSRKESRRTVEKLFEGWRR